MFDSLSDKLEGVFRKIRGTGKLTEANIAEALRDVRMALLEAAGEITDTLVSTLGLSYDDAEHAQSGASMGAEMDAKIRAVLERGAAELADAINQSLRFLWRTASDEPLQAVFFTGGGSRVPGLIDSLATRLDTPVEMANPFGRVQINRSLDTVALEEMAPSLGVAVGLGTRRPGDA